ncbi:MAG: hypothetical protein ACOYNS_02070 [Bacteroidota bacterium]
MKKFSYTVLLTVSETEQSASETIEAYRTFLTSSIQSKAAELQKQKADVIQKNGTILRGGLTQFLSTPLKSDKDEIIKLIEDSIENSVQQLDAAPMLGTVEHSLWRVVDPQEVPLHKHSIGVVKRMLKEGKTMLTEAGCTFGKNAPPVIVSHFQFDGFSTILPLQKIIDQAGDQKLITQVNNVMRTFTAAPEKYSGSDRQMLLIDLNVNETSAIESMLSEIRTLLENEGVNDVVCSVQTFHSRVGAVLQIACSLDSDTVPIGKIVMTLAEFHPELKTALNNHSMVTLLQPLS